MLPKKICQQVRAEQIMSLGELGKKDRVSLSGGVKGAKGDS